jgi:hypothetical protein
MENNQTNYPMVLVFYLDAELMKNKDIIVPFTQAVDDMLNKKNANALAFFLPTNGEERIECINPIMLKEAEMGKINTMLEEIKKSFSIGDETEPTMKEGKPCECGNNPEGNCKCD